MDIYNKIIDADYPLMDMEIKDINIQNYSYRAVNTVVQVSLWNKDIENKQTILFSEELFVIMMMKRKKGQYAFEESAYVLGKNGGDVKKALEEESLDIKEVEQAIRESGRIHFRVSHIELGEYMYHNESVPRKEAINIIANSKKKQLAPMPTQEAPCQEAA